MSTLEMTKRSGHRRLPVLFLAGVVTLWGHPVAAAGYNLNEIMHQALIRNHDLKAARAQVNAALGRLKQSGLWPNPRLELSNESDRVFANQGAFTRSVGLTQDFPIAGRIGRAQDVSRVDVARALAEVNEAERTLLAEVAKSFYEIVVLDQKIALRDRLINVEASLVATSTNRQKAGEVSELDVNAATLELQRLHQERIVLTGQRAAALRTLAGLVGLPSNAALAVNTALPPFIRLPPVAQLVDQALRRRPDLRLLVLAENRALAEQLLAKASAWEDWSVSLGVRQDKLFIEGAPPQQADSATMMKLTIPLPLFNRNQGTEAAAEADREAAREKFAALQVRIENEVSGKFEQVKRLLEAIRAYNEQTLPLSRRDAELARDAYGKGQLSISEVVQAGRREIDLNTSYADTLALYLRAIAELNAASVAQARFETQPVKH
jgi:cobalt-zinc-cadmium efflux system outer membrane protein